MGRKYPKIADCEIGYVHLSTYFKYPQAVSCLIYTTNTIEESSIASSEVTKSKGVFPTDDSLFKDALRLTNDKTSRKNGQAAIND